MIIFLYMQIIWMTFEFPRQYIKRYNSFKKNPRIDLIFTEMTIESGIFVSVHQMKYLAEHLTAIDQWHPQKYFLFAFKKWLNC